MQCPPTTEECVMTQTYAAVRRPGAERKAWSVLIVGIVSLLGMTAPASAQWDYPVDHAMSLNDPNLCTKTTRYEPSDFPWTGATRGLAIQPITVNYDMIVTDDLGWARVSQLPGREVEFVVFDASSLHDDTRDHVGTTVDVYTNGNDRGMYYAYYVEAPPVEWDGKHAAINFDMWYYELVEARQIYLKAGIAYRFDIDRSSADQTGFASLMRTDPRSRIQTRPQAVAEFDWRGAEHDDFVYVPEEGWYTLVVVQENGDALGLGLVTNTLVVPRGERPVNDNDIRITITAE